MWETIQAENFSGRWNERANPSWHGVQVVFQSHRGFRTFLLRWMDGNPMSGRMLIGLGGEGSGDTHWRGCGYGLPVWEGNIYLPWDFLLQRSDNQIPHS